MEEIIFKVINWGTGIIVIIFLITLLFLAFQILTNKGNKKKTIRFTTILYIIISIFLSISNATTRWNMWFPNKEAAERFYKEKPIDNTLFFFYLLIPLAIPYLAYYIYKLVKEKNRTKKVIIGLILSSLPIVAVLLGILRM